MAGLNLDPPSSLVIGSGPMSIPNTTTNTLAGGPRNVMQTIISQFPPPILTSQTVPSIMHGGSGTSTHTIPPVIHGGSGPSTTVPQLPPVTQVHHVPTNPTTITGLSHINLGSNLPFMACLNFPDLARLTNDPICHQAFWPPIPTNLPSDIPKFEGKSGDCPLLQRKNSYGLGCTTTDR